MDRLFSDAETFQKERPTKMSAEQQRDLYLEIAQEIIDEGWSESNIEDIAQDVSEISFNDSGYEIAKDLERHKKAYYDIDTSFIEFLDDLSWKKRERIQENVKTWVLAHNPKPKFEKGQKLIVDTSLDYEKKKGVVVFVTGVSEKTACYLIDENQERAGGTVIAYERVESNCSKID
jgi:hypothetical protein